MRFHDKTLCDMIMLKYNRHRHLCSFVQVGLHCTKAVSNVTGHHFFMFLKPTKLFLITNMRVATEEFLCYVFLLLLVRS